METQTNGAGIGRRTTRGNYNPIVSREITARNGYEVRVEDIVRTWNNLLLQSIGSEHLVRLSPFLKRVNLARDQYLYQQDDNIENIFFPETALISEFQILEDGRMIEVGMIGREGSVGIASGFTVCRAANCMQVCIAGTALVIGRDLFEREVLSDPQLQITLHNYINGQIKQLSQRVVCNTFHSVEQRFCSWLLTLQGRSHRDNFRITHEHVARALGVHRPSVTCIAQSLRERNLIDYGRARLSITDNVGLEELACGCGTETRVVNPSH